jgi:tetratricopeptide (TPR) repeat protein
LLLALPIVFLTVLAAAAPVEKPTAQQIAQWVQQLGDNKFSVREQASKKLWAAGSAAESALEEALKSDDAEVVRRARDILDKFKWGIYPDTPADTVALIRAYQAADNNRRLEILPALLQGGPAGLQAVLKIVRNEKDDNQRKALGRSVSNELPAAMPRVVEHDAYEKFETLLEIGHESGSIKNNQYTAYWLLRGKLDERIAHFRSLLTKNPNEERYAETLVYLHRAKGDLAEARKAAEKTKRDDLLEGILYEAADWKALAARPVPANEGDPEKWGYRAAYARLAGDQKAFESAVSELRKFADANEPREFRVFVAAKALLLNDRPRDGLAMLGAAVGLKALRFQILSMRFEILCAQLKYDQAMKVIEEGRPAESTAQKQLEVLKARTLYLLGDKDKAQALFARLAGEIKDGVDPDWVSSLLETEYKIGLKDLAFEHCARALSAALPGNVKKQGQGVYLSKLFPKQSEAAEEWWELLRQKHKGETNAATLKRLRDLMAGKVAAKEVKTWIEEAERALSAPKPEVNPALRRRALAEAAATAGLDDMAVSLLEKADTPEALLRLGDLLAGKKQWEKVAERYRQAWRKSVTPDSPRLSAKAADPLPLYLAGDALVKAGQEKEGKKLIEQAHWMSLGDVKARFAFLRVLAERGHTEAAARETELLRRVSDPNTYYSGADLRRLALAAVARKEYFKAADGFEQSMLRCLHLYTNFVQNGAYAAVPSQVHQLRATGLLAAGKLDEASKHIDMALDYSPGNVDLPIKLVPELERRGHKKEATALFERSFGAYDKVCRDYPRCSWAHNSAAWLCACCRRNLDKGLEHSKKAVELAPDNAGYLDTLAEIHFQRGDKDKAVALQKRAIELDPKKPYFRKQLKRLEAGDPSAERPPENDD